MKGGTEARAATKESKPISEWKILACCGLFLVAVFSLLANPSIRDALWSTEPEGVVREFDSKLDPKIGSVFSLPPVDLLGREIRGPEGAKRDLTLLVMAGVCTECSLDSVLLRKIDPSPYSGVVLVYTGDEALLRSAGRKLSPELKLLFDKDGSMHKLLNASFQPRFFLLDSRNRIVSMQKKYSQIPNFVTLKK